MNKTTLLILLLAIIAVIGWTVYNNMTGKPLRSDLPLTQGTSDMAEDKELELIRKTNPEHLVFVLLHGHDGIYVYEKLDASKGRKIDYQAFGNYIGEKIQKDSNLLVVIKPGLRSTYANSVNMLDEMEKNKVRKYLMVSETKEERKLIDSVFK